MWVATKKEKANYKRKRSYYLDNKNYIAITKFMLISIAYGQDFHLLECLRADVPIGLQKRCGATGPWTPRTQGGHGDDCKTHVRKRPQENFLTYGV